MRAVVVSHGEVDPADAEVARGADLIVAADGGSEHLALWGIVPHVVVGDLDSLSAEARARVEQRGGETERWPAEKDKTDTELAVDRAVASGADEVVVLGALGGPRDDHALANVALLALERDRRVRLRIVRGATSVRACRAGETCELSGRVGDLVTLIAFGSDAEGVRTEGLRYPLRGETLRLGSSRGVSNEVAAAGARVTLALGALLVVESRAGG
jgi:thiamine pyrophosphokinase